MRVLVTGASGFIGGFLTEALLKKGYRVKVLIRSKSNLKWIADLDIDCCFGDLLKPDSFKKALKNIDYIYHVAGITKARKKLDYYLGNYQATKNLIEEINKSGIKLKRFLYVSSQSAIGSSPTILPLDESAEPHPLTPYGKSKLASEEYLKKYRDKLPITLVRPPSVYGPRDMDILNFMRIVKKGVIPNLGLNDKYLSLIYVKDLVEGMIVAAESANSIGKAYFLTNPQPYSWEEFAVTVLKTINKKGIRIYIPPFMAKGLSVLTDLYSDITDSASIFNREKFREMMQEFWVCSPKRAKQDLNFEAKTPLDKGIAETIGWYVEQGWL
ncbi:MAG: NAD(P)-dependent oxidoreductase [Calditrichaceae bacterium]|nr:NAD(P)-dependent oxidoreductase [Calditrichaceae bacterium]MBN2709138.1 NAD(P)-dependent oxidoreductase [Calditrichaceae bacterium]RQV96094.1 MAG: NAD(P)-dependent oxidoreductase [Calditrichota bacterium]